MMKVKAVYITLWQNIWTFGKHMSFCLMSNKCKSYKGQLFIYLLSLQVSKMTVRKGMKKGNVVLIVIV